MKTAGMWLVLLLVLLSGDFGRALLPTVSAQEKGERGTEWDVLPKRIRECIEGFSGEVYFSAKNLKTGELISYRADSMVQTASVIKLAILLEAFAQRLEGRITFERGLQLRPEDPVPGAGILQDLSPSVRLSLRDALVLMTVLSDNTATNMILDVVGIDAVNRRLENLGLVKTFLNKRVFKPAAQPIPEERARFGLGATTPLEMQRLLEMIYRHSILDEAGCSEIIGILKKQRDREGIPRYLSGSDWSNVEVAHKTGALDRLRNDVGIVFSPEGDFILSLFAQESSDQKWTPDNEATLTLAQLALELVSIFRGLEVPSRSEPSLGK